MAVKFACVMCGSFVKVQKHAGHFVRQWIISALLQQHSHQAGRGLR